MSFSVAASDTALHRAMRAMQADIHKATRRATAMAAHYVEAATKAELGRRSHSAGTATPSPPGAAPAVVTGTLRRSVHVEGPTRVGFGVYRASVGPSTVYAAIQERGGDIFGRPLLKFRYAGGFVQIDHVHIPERPYLKPSTERAVSSGAIRDIYRREWAGATGGRR